MSEKIRVLIADDHSVVRKGLRGFLETYPDIEVVGEAENGVEAVALAKENVPDVILMDLLMPEMGGVEAISKIVMVSPTSRIIVLTSYTEDEFLFPAMRAGAHGYLLKDIEPEELVSAIRVSVRGQVTIHPSVAEKLMREVSKSEDDPLADLTQRELEILRLIAQGKRNREIAEELTLAEGTVKSHVSNILSKLHLTHRTQAALFALKKKLLLLDDPNNDDEVGKI